MLLISAIIAISKAVLFLSDSIVNCTAIISAINAISKGMLFLMSDNAIEIHIFPRLQCYLIIV